MATAAVLTAVLASAPAMAQVSITVIGVAVTEDFNTLANTGTSSTTPTGWTFLEVGTNANTLYTAGTGSSTTGDTYSFGSAASVDRAFGTLFSGSLNSTIGAQFINNTGVTINTLDISYTGEEWRYGPNPPARTDSLFFQYSLNATSLSTGTWVSVKPLDFATPNTSPAAPTALDGNLAVNRTAISSSITGLAIANGATFWIRWSEFNALGSDDGLGVDDFSLTARVSIVPVEGNTWGKIKTLYR